MRAVGALGHFLEAEGVATTQITLIRPHTEQIRPPRALWTPFEFGRPLGAPGDPGFQRRVLRAALALLAEPDCPVLRDFPDDAPAAPPDAGWACPVQLPTPEADPDDPATPVLRELALLRPWHDQFVQRHGRTAFGAGGRPIDDVEELAALVARFAAGQDVVAEGCAHPHPIALKYICDDLRAYWTEAALAQPGPAPVSADLAAWLWHDTALGAAIRATAQRLAAMEPRIAWLSKTILPDQFG